LLAHPTTRCYTLINAGKFKDRTPDNTIPSWLLPCTCYLPRCKCPARLRPDILCILGTTPTAQPPFSPNPSLKIQIFEFTYCNDRFPQEATTRKLEKYDILLPLLTQQGWAVLPQKIITAGIRGSIHTATTKSLLDLKIPNNKIQKLMETFSQISIRYLTHIILNKRKLEKKQAPIPLD